MSHLSFIMFLTITLPLYLTWGMVQCPQTGLTWLSRAQRKYYQSGFQSATLGWLKTRPQITYQVYRNIWTANLWTNPAQMNPLVNIMDVHREHQLMKLWYEKCQLSRELTLMLYRLSKLTREMAQHLSARHQPMKHLPTKNITKCPVWRRHSRLSTTWDQPNNARYSQLGRVRPKEVWKELEANSTIKRIQWLNS